LSRSARAPPTPSPARASSGRRDHLVVDEPALLAFAEGVDLDLEAIALHVDAGGEHEAAGGHLALLVAARRAAQHVDLRLLALDLVRLAEHGVVEHLLERLAGLLVVAALLRLEVLLDRLAQENQPSGE
jgi:hypothetical protein